MNIFRTTLLISLLTYTACPKPPPPPIPPQPVSICKADSSWITEPKQPNEVASSETFCDFHQFSWQWFLAQTSPAADDNQPVFFKNKVYDPNGQKHQCANTSLTGIQGIQHALQARGIKPSKFEEIQADGNPLYDQNGNILYYNALYSEALCHADENNFVPGTLEIKVSWMLLDEGAHNSYFVINAKVPEIEEEVTLGLVGIHMAIWTKNHPEMIWATWEHKQNTPVCDGSSKVQPYNLAAETAAKCLSDEKSKDKCPQYNFNTPTKKSGKPTPVSTPNQICREFPYGNEPGESINGNDNQANLKAIMELNEQLVGDKGLLTLLDDKDPMKVWSNYEMIGGLWTKDGQASGNSPVPTKAGAGDPLSHQRGSLELSNMTMETFEQGADSYIPNCFGCHNYDPKTPLTVSHIYQNLK